MKKHGKPHPMIEETKQRLEEFIQNMGNLLFNKVEVNIGSSTFVTEFDNGEQTDYTLIDLEKIRKESQKMLDEIDKQIHDGDKSNLFYCLSP